MAASPALCSMDPSGRLLRAPCSANTPQKWRLGVLVLLQILCFQTARSQVPPEISLKPYWEPAGVADTAKLMAQCKVTSTPRAYITWDTGSFIHDARGSGILYYNQTATISSDLLMKPRRELLNFQVTCVVTQENIQYNRSFYISNIHFAPYNVYIGKNQREDGVLEIYCEATANPSPSKYKWTWVKGYETVHIPFVKYRVTVPKNASDGYYICEVENSLGRASGRFYVAPEFEHPYWYVALIFLIPSLILNVGLFIHCLKSRRPTESPSKVVI